MKNKCFANYEMNQCEVLEVEECSGKNCRFYKTAEDLEAGRSKAFTRLASLSRNTQRRIAENYYEAQMPWQKGGKTNDN